VLFERILGENGITHRLTGVRSPTTTGKIERFHQTLRKELLATLPPLPTLEVAQEVLDAWVEDYNQRRPHQALGGHTPAERFHTKPDLDHPDQDGGTVLPLWLPAALDPQRGMPAAEPVGVQTPPGAEANPAGSTATVLPLEVDATVPACGNLGVAGRQVWLGRRLAGRTVQVRLDGATMHLSLDGRLLKTLPCRLRPELLGQGRLQSARPAGPPPAPMAAHAVLLGPGDGVEVDRRVNAAGTVGVAGQQVSVGLPLAGQTVTLRLEAATMHVLADGALVRSLPSPVPVTARARLQGARLARGALVIPQRPVVVRRRASQRGQLQVAGERVQVGLAHARQVLTVHVAEREFRIFDEGGLIKVIARRDHQEVTRFKAHKQHKPHGSKG
jgi:Integrase core domain